MDCYNFKAVFSFFLRVFCVINFRFIPLLPEGRAGESWEPSNKVMLCLPPPLARVNSTSDYTPLSLSLSLFIVFK